VSAAQGKHDVDMAVSTPDELRRMIGKEREFG
jgi:hypothetical protein